MLIRIQLGRGPHVRKTEGKNRHLAIGAAGLLPPAALVAASLGVWSAAAMMGLAGEFAIPDGFFSHWQVWVILAGALEGISILLNRYGQKRQQSGHTETPGFTGPNTI